MADDFRRPGPYVPISTSLVTGRTGTAILERYGAEGIGVWIAMLTAARDGLIVFRHDADWTSIGLDLNPPSFALSDFLKFLGRRKQTRTTRQGRTHYVEITQWERWNHAKKREQARQRNARYRRKSERHESVTESVTPASRDRHPEAETETELEQVHKPKAVEKGLSREPVENADPEWAAEDEERPQDFQIPEVVLKEIA